MSVINTIINVIKELPTMSNKLLNVIEFQDRFPEQWNYVVDHIEKHPEKSCVVTAPVKSGKRILMEIQSMRSMRPRGPQIEKHILITSLNRKDTQEQIDELKGYGIETVVLARKSHVKKAIDLIEESIRNGCKGTAHIDESDYGAAEKQLMEDVYKRLRELDYRIICYSATNEEVLFSSFVDNAVVLPEFEPNKNYRGAGWFLDEGLVEDAEPFWDNGLTKQGKEACEFFAASDKPLSVLRFTPTTKELEADENFHKSLTDYKIRPVFVDSNRSFNWSESYKQYVREYEAGMGRTLLVICQTCSRSTEVGFHKHIAFWHDYRGDSSPYGTMNQAFLRVSHYHKTGEPDKRIKIYALTEVFELAAKRITHEEFHERTGRKLAQRVASTGLSLSDDPSEYDVFVTTNPDDLFRHAKEKHGINLKGGWEKNADGKYICTIRGHKKVWTEDEVEKELFWGISTKETKGKSRSRHRSVVYYDASGVAKFRFVIHTGATKQGEIKSTKTMWNGKISAKEIVPCPVE